MIKVEIELKNNDYKSIRALGHANYSPPGQEDIVCAAVSTLIQTAVQGIMNLSKYDTYVLAKGNQSIALPDEISESDQHCANIIFETVSLGIASIAAMHPKNVKVYYREGESYEELNIDQFEIVQP